MYLKTHLRIEKNKNQNKNIYLKIDNCSENKQEEKEVTVPTNKINHIKENLNPKKI